jgi:hypothetical protein
MVEPAAHHILLPVPALLIARIPLGCLHRRSDCHRVNDPHYANLLKKLMAKGYA